MLDKFEEHEIKDITRGELDLPESEDKATDSTAEEKRTKRIGKPTTPCSNA